MPKHSIAFFGTPDFSVPILQALSEEFEISLVISQPDKPVGKGLKVQSSPVSRFARNHNLPLLTPSSLRTDDAKKTLLGYEVDVAVVVAYGKILPQWVLDWPRHGAINIHGSLLPKHRGASPIAASILAGDNQTGLSYIKMNAEMDAGDVLCTSTVDIYPDDTTESLGIKLSSKASEDINTVVESYLKGALIPTPQDHIQASYADMIQKDDGYIDLDQPPANLHRMVRAYHPWPGTWTQFRGKRVKLLPNQMVQMEGKKATDLKSFLNGYPDFPLREW